MRKVKGPRLVDSWRASMALREEKEAGERDVVVLNVQGVLKRMSYKTIQRAFIGRTVVGQGLILENSIFKGKAEVSSMRKSRRDHQGGAS